MIILFFEIDFSIYSWNVCTKPINDNKLMMIWNCIFQPVSVFRIAFLNHSKMCAVRVVARIVAVLYFIRQKSIAELITIIVRIVSLYGVRPHIERENCKTWISTTTSFWTAINTILTGVSFALNDVDDWCSATTIDETMESLPKPNPVSPKATGVRKPTSEKGGN